jgi:hypothetical protein
MPRCAIPRVFRVPNTLNGALRVPPPPARPSFSAYLLMIYRLKIRQKCYSSSQFNNAAAGGTEKSEYFLGLAKRNSLIPQGRQSAKLYLQSSEWGLPQPLTRRQECPPPPRFGSGGRGTLAGERGGGRVPIPTRGHMYTEILYIFMYFVLHTLPFQFLPLQSIPSNPFISNFYLSNPYPLTLSI